MSDDWTIGADGSASPIDTHGRALWSLLVHGSGLHERSAVVRKVSE